MCVLFLSLSRISGNHLMKHPGLLFCVICSQNQILNLHSPEMLFFFLVLLRHHWVGLL